MKDSIKVLMNTIGLTEGIGNPNKWFLTEVAREKDTTFQIRNMLKWVCLRLRNPQGLLMR